MLTKIQDGHNVGVFKSTENLNLALKTGFELGITHKVRGKDLERDITVFLQIERFIDGGHSTLPDLLKDVVSPLDEP